LFFGLYPKPLIDALEGPVNEQVALIQRAVEGTAETPDTIFVRPDETQGDGGND